MNDEVKIEQLAHIQSKEGGLLRPFRLLWKSLKQITSMVSKMFKNEANGLFEQFILVLHFTLTKVWQQPIKP